MRLSVTHLRILILLANILLGLGVPAFAAYRYYLTTTPKVKGVTLVDPKKLEPRDDGAAPAGSDSASKLLIVATWLQPKAPPPPPTEGNPPGPDLTKPSPTTDAQAGAGGELEPGKLGDEGWCLVEYIIRSDPLKNYAILRKKDPSGSTIPPPGGPASKAVNPRIRTTARPPVGGKPRVGKISPQQAGDKVSFHVYERRYTNEELGLDFMIESLDHKRFVYWLPDNPKKLFALKYTPESQYLVDPDEGIRPKPKPPEEAAPGAPEEKKKPGIIVRTSKEYEPIREKEYQEMKQGIGLEAIDAPSEGGVRTVKKAPESAAAPGAALAPPLGPGPARPPGATPGAGPAFQRGPRQPTAAEAKQLKEAIQAIPPDAQKQLLDGLKKSAVNAPKG